MAPPMASTGRHGPCGSSYLARILAGSIASMNHDYVLGYLHAREAMGEIRDDRIRRYRQPRPPQTAPPLSFWLVASVVYAGIGVHDGLRWLFLRLAKVFRAIVKAKQRVKLERYERMLMLSR